ncbi:MAG: hypothetical protein Q9227_004993 [Pyrenula ochraceoflavens]
MPSITWRTPDAKRDFKESMNFLVAFEANLRLIHDYRTKNVVQAEYERFRSFLQSKQALRELFETDTTIKKMQSMKQAFNWNIRDLNKKVHELRQALTQILSVLGLYLQYELDNQIGAVSENIQNLGRLIRGNQEGMTATFDRFDYDFKRAIKSLQGAQVSWELLLRDAMHEWIAATKDQSNTHSTRLDEQTETIDTLKAQVEAQTKALLSMRSDMEGMMNQVSSAMETVSKGIDDEIQIHNAEDSKIVHRSKKVHKQHRSVEKLLLINTQAGNLVNNCIEQVPRSICRIQMATLFKQLDTRVRQIGLSSIMERFARDCKRVGKGIGRRSLRTIGVLQLARALIELNRNPEYSPSKQLHPSRAQVDGTASKGLSIELGEREECLEPPQPTAISSKLTLREDNTFQRPNIRAIQPRSRSQPNLLVPPRQESQESSLRKSSYDRSKKAPPPPPPLRGNKISMTGKERLSDLPAGLRSTDSVQTPSPPPPPPPPNCPPPLPISSTSSSQYLTTARIFSPRDLSPKSPHPASSRSPPSRTPPPVPSKKALLLSQSALMKPYSPAAGVSYQRASVDKGC